MKTIIKGTLKRMLYIGGCCALPKQIRILFYHSVDNSGSPLSTSIETFEKQMSYLKKKGYRTISLSNYINNIYQKHTQHKNLVLITFDDGFKSTYLHAFPVLKKYGFIATVFLITDYINGLAGWIKKDVNLIEDRIFNSSISENELHEIIKASNFPMLTWEEIKKMDDYGMEFGSHTSSHIWLGKSTTEEIREDIIRSKAIIEEKLKKPAAFFSYPYSDYKPETKEIVKDLGFRAACGGDPRADRSPNDLFGLKRTGPFPAENFFEFKFIFSVAFDWYIGLAVRIKSMKCK